MCGPQHRAMPGVRAARERVQCARRHYRADVDQRTGADSLPGGAQVAIKVIDKTLIASCPGLAERVRVEAETHILLDHPSIVRLHTFFEDDSNVYFVMVNSAQLLSDASIQPVATRSF